MPTISRKEYASLFGPTVGDKIRRVRPTFISKLRKTSAAMVTNRSMVAVNHCVMEWDRIIP